MRYTAFVFFSKEFTDNKILQWCLGALAFGYFIVFYSWIGRDTLAQSSVEQLSYTCPTYFQDCSWMYFLEGLPNGYSQSFFYMLLFAALVGAVYSMSQGRWREAQLFLLPSFIWHTLAIFVMSFSLGGNYEYYLFIFGLILLFLPHKEFFLKLAIVFFYVLSTVAKIHPAWVEGGYFKSMYTGLPLFPDWSIPYFTNFVILAEMVLAWCLMKKESLVQRSAFFFFFIFHIYSGILVFYRYPATVLPFLFILFGPKYRYTQVPLDRKSLIGWGLFAVLLFCQFFPRVMIAGDEKLTLEGNRYGLYMFESSHQCISEQVRYKTDGSEQERAFSSASARNRCNPYNIWYSTKMQCDRPDIERISWNMYHSINGDPFLKIVDTENACDLEYKPFSHNEWIKTYEDNPEIFGYPAKNYYY